MTLQQVLVLLRTTSPDFLQKLTNDLATLQALDPTLVVDFLSTLSTNNEASWVSFVASHLTSLLALGPRFQNETALLNAIEAAAGALPAIAAVATPIVGQVVAAVPNKG